MKNLDDVAKKLALSTDATITITQLAQDLFAVDVDLLVLPEVEIKAFSPFLGTKDLVQVAFRINVTWALLTHQTFLPKVIKDYRKKCETTEY